jgi:hypothetical protein
MPTRALPLLAVVLATALTARGADDVEGVKEKFFQAKKEYDGEVQKFRKATGDTFDKREDAARNAGDRRRWTR